MAPGTKLRLGDMVGDTATAVPNEEPSRLALVHWEDFLGHRVSKSKWGTLGLVCKMVLVWTEDRVCKLGEDLKHPDVGSLGPS